VCLTHHKGKCYQCAFEKLCDGKATITDCETMKKTEFDQRVAEKTSHIQEKIDEIIAHIIDKQNDFIEFIEIDPRRSVDDALDHLLELNANYNPKFETENQKRLIQTTEELDVLSLVSNESSRTSSPDPSQELESVRNLIQTGARKMSERVAGFKNLWASFTGTSDIGQKLYRDISWSNDMTDGPTISGQSLVKSSGHETPQFGWVKHS